MWNTALWADDQAVEDEANTTGRMGRFNKRFDGIGGAGGSVDWMAGTGEGSGIALEGQLVDPSKYVIKTKKKKGGGK